MAKKTIADIDRFLQRLRKVESGCWEWTLAPDRDGYGLFSVGSATDGSARRVRAARWAYEEFVGPIPDGMHTDHLCRNRICVNPDHLEPVTPKENVHRSANFNKPYCVHGHAMTPDNTYVQPSTGCRSCRICRARLMAEYRAKIGAAAVNKYQREWDRENRRRKRGSATN